ncbi:THO complex subunit 4-B [Dirofilaria immitis]|nr:THO complex subunit 4-B [Dirofilaria immitis]
MKEKHEILSAKGLVRADLVATAITVVREEDQRLPRLGNSMRSAEVEARLCTSSEALNYAGGFCGRADKKSNGSISRIRNIRKKRDYGPEYATNNSAFTRPEASLLDVPSGKWDHSGFEEMYGDGSGDGPLPSSERGGKFSRVDLARKVRLHITNLAPTVNSADLNELFEEYSIYSATVNYDEMGESVGTADVVTDRITAREIIANLDGVALDGEVMAFHMIDDQAIPSSVRVKDRLSFRERSRGITKATVEAYGHHRRDRSKRLQMTDEELDRELEEYMNKRSQKQNEQEMEI